MGAETTPLAPTGWTCNRNGQVVDAQPRGTAAGACFKHSHALRPGEVVRLRVEEEHYAFVGFAGEEYDVKRDAATEASTAWVNLVDGSSCIGSDISHNGKEHDHEEHHGEHVSPRTPYDLALRVEAVSSVPQIQFTGHQWLQH